jgi:catechol 2,3-dioxygenase-like lactoylglutathione lyase family enzyme
MKFESLSPILTTDDMDRSVRFYVDVLGFTCCMQTPGYSNLYRDGVRNMLGGPNSHEPWARPHLTGQLYINLNEPNEVDALWSKIKDRVEVVYYSGHF